MGTIRWDDGLMTGDYAVDRQHRAIHSLFNELEGAEDDHRTLQRALEALAEHVLVHFSTEEDLMRRSGFPTNLERIHKHEHRLFLNGIRAEILAFRDGELRSIKPLVEFLHDWLLTHVHECDRQLVAFVKSSGCSGKLGDEWYAAEARLSESA
jgi:hemerythrin